MKRPVLLVLFLGLVATGLAVPILCAAASKKAAGAAAPGSDLDQLSGSLEALTRRVSPAVVQVFSSALAPVAAGGDAAGGLLSQQRRTGSGVIVDPSGFIVTNAHVVQGVRRVQVQLSEPRPGPAGQSTVKAAGRRYDARIVGTDQESDLAVLKIEGSGFATLPFADSDALRQGQLVLAFGSPFGLGGSVSLGVVSATVRQLEPDARMIYLQTDADIHPGNSGGPLVDTQGRIVGINTALLGSDADKGVGLASPSNIVSHVYRQIRDHGSVRRGEMGARGQTVTPELARGLGLSRDWGVVIADVTPGGPADVAGLRMGDMVLALDGKVMENARQLDVNLYRRSAGDQVTLDTEREGQHRTVRVLLTERAGDVNGLAGLVQLENNVIDPLHIIALEVDASVARIIPMREPWGVLVVLSTGDAPPGGAPLLPGDVIRSIDRSAVRSLDDLRQPLAQRKSGDWVVLHVERRGRMTYVPVEVP